VISDETIVGRVIAGGLATLITSQDALITVDLDHQSSVRTPVTPLDPGEHPWGLAEGQAGHLWTLVGRTELVQLTYGGRIVRRVRLHQPHVNVFGFGNRLLYQVMDFKPPAPALLSGAADEQPRRAWGRMFTRSLPLNRGAVAALNLVSCGATAASEIACWFPDESSVTITDAEGQSRALALAGLPTTPLEILLTSDNPRRPIRDAFIDGDRTLWILASGNAPPDRSDRPGGWLVARYGADGSVLSRRQLPEPARLILGVRQNSCLLLAWSGYVVEAGL
jgi:hypothetical protein